ncbi:DNA-binding protein [Candidatus Bathyarchaeota archaeon]|nr:DNA-binding protein [Candidatus Bathyarchaeota archaeon]
MSGRGGEAEVLVLDTSAFISGYGAPGSGEALYTVPAVKGEVREGGLQRLRLENAERTGVLTVLEPGEKYRKEVQRVLAEMGETRVLSEADTQILSLGLQLKTEGKNTAIVSDDYAVQNVADRLGLGIKSLVTRGIKKRYRWTTYCPGCRRTYQDPPRDGVCQICGTKLKRRPSTEREIA